MKAVKKNKPDIFKVFIRIIPIMYKSAPVFFIFSCVTDILHGLFWGIETMFQQRFFDKATEFANGNTLLSGVMISLLSLGLVSIICQVLNGVGNFIPMLMVDKCQGKLSFQIHEKIGKLSPVVFEDTDKLDAINKAEQGKSSAVWFSMIFMMIITFYVPYFIFISFYLFSLKPILSLAIIIVFVPTGLTQIIRTKVFSKLEDKSAPIRREYDYYEKCMVHREYFKETRLLGGFKFFKDLYLDTLRNINKLSLKANIKTNLTELAMKLMTVGGYILILYMLFDALMKKEITVGAFAAVFTSVAVLYNIMEELVCRHIGQIAQGLGTIQNYLDFLELEERKGEDMEIPKGCDISLDNVTFAYPKSEKAAIKKANLKIKNGETIAIVGENGSGKSTIIRLITGLYTPNTGTVKYGDISTDRISFSKLLKNTSAVFQKYCRYQMSLSDNINISHMEKQAENKELDRVCNRAGLSKDDECFTDGYDTMLSREFDGVDLSGGQWQRVTIARGFFRPHNLIILDEPTAAIDPFEETKIYNRFAKMSKDKTAIIVTHRLGSVKLADRIVVMKEGEIVESGTHDELMNNDSEYARMYMAQQQWYREEKNA